MFSEFFESTLGLLKKTVTLQNKTAYSKKDCEAVKFFNFFLFLDFFHNFTAARTKQKQHEERPCG
ncbi:MAG: hypothetical protein EA361_18185 [Bacteroidetes bacterium]|nr:MAG: hypothetical protein EA361_18185 [Bacteroidota bacterium]